MLNSSEIGKHILAYIGLYSIHVDTLLLSWLVMAVLVVSAWLSPAA